jgi:hypothetical protein
VRVDSNQMTAELDDGDARSWREDVHHRLDPRTRFLIPYTLWRLFDRGKDGNLPVSDFVPVA